MKLFDIVSILLLVIGLFKLFNLGLILSKKSSISLRFFQPTGVKVVKVSL